MGLITLPLQWIVLPCKYSGQLKASGSKMLNSILACQGIELDFASVPPTIFVDMSCLAYLAPSAMPHSGIVSSGKIWYEF